MNNIKQYDYVDGQSDYSGHNYCGMVERPEGKFVLAEDYDALMSELKSLKAGQGEAVAVMHPDGRVTTKAECLHHGGTFKVLGPSETPLYTAAPCPIHEVLTEHSGCGRGIQVDQITVRMYPGDKVVMIRGKIGAVLADRPT